MKASSCTGAKKPLLGSAATEKTVISLLVASLCLSSAMAYAGSSKFKDKIVISEIMYHPSTMVDNDKQEFIELFNATGDAAAPTQNGKAIDLSSWEFTSGIKFMFPANTVLNPGEYIVVAADEQQFRTTYDPGYTIKLANKRGKGWSGRLSNGGEEIKLEDSSGKKVDSVEYGSTGVWSYREQVQGALYYKESNHSAEKDWEYKVVTSQLPSVSNGWQLSSTWSGVAWSEQADGGGYSLELVNPNGKNGNGQAWAISLQTNGTPGIQNSNHANDVAPFISGLKQDPAIPSSTDSVKITVEVQDDNQEINSVILYYCLDDGAKTCQRFTSVLMSEKKGVYKAVIPAHSSESIIEYYIEAQDIAGNKRTLPEAVKVNNNQFAQIANALYQVNDRISALTDEDIGLMPRYYVILKEHDRAQLESIGNIKQWYLKINLEMNSSFVSIKLFSKGIKIDNRQTLGMRLRGSGSRLQRIKSYRINFPFDQTWDDREKININAVNPEKQHIGSVLYRYAGLPAAKTELIKFEVNGDNLQKKAAHKNYVSLWVLNKGDFTKDVFSNDADGNLYKIVNSKKYSNKPADLSNYSITDKTAMRTVYQKQTNKEDYDYSDIEQLVTELADGNTAHVNVEQWLKFIAFDSLMGNDETGLGTGAGDDYALYRGELDDRFVIVARDLDSVFKTAITRPITKGYADFPGFAFMKLASDSVYRENLYKTYRELLAETYRSDLLNPILDAELGNKISTIDLNSFKTFIKNRSASVASVLASELETDITTNQTVSGEWKVNKKINIYSKFTIKPGTKIFFGNNGRLVVRRSGQIVAQGTPEQHITLTSKDNNTWNGIALYGSKRNNILSYVDMEFANSRNKPSKSYTSMNSSERKKYNDYLKDSYNIKIKNSRLLIDHMSWKGSKETILEISNSSAIIRDSIFPTVDNNHTIHGRGLPKDGFLIIEGNIFGTTTGYSDVIDFTGGKHPNSIIKIINNRFIGGSDDGLDLDNTDAYIANNIFSGFKKQNDSFSSSNAVAADGETVGNAAEITLVNNIFFNNDHHVLLKGRASIKVAGEGHDSEYYSTNNLLYNSTFSAINFAEPERSVRAGGHVAMKNSIFSNNALNFEHIYYEKSGDAIVVKNRTFASTLFNSPEFVASTDSSKVVDDVTAEIFGEPIFADTANGNFKLTPSSAGKYAGDNGLDIGPKVLPKLAVTEVMYSPDGSDRLYEFIEIKNIGEYPLDLTQLSLAIDGEQALDASSSLIEKAFVEKESDNINLLNVNEYAVFVKNVDGFKERYLNGQAISGGNFHIIGNVDEKLSNDGGNISLTNELGDSLVSFTYQATADAGHSLVLIDETVGTGDWYTDKHIQAVMYDTSNKYNKAITWSSSLSNNGSAGRQDSNSHARIKPVKWDCGTETMFLRGTFNNWDNLAMECVDGKWTATSVEFYSGDAEPRFRFDANGDGKEQYGFDSSLYGAGRAVRNAYSIEVTPNIYTITFDFFRKKFTIESNEGNS